MKAQRFGVFAPWWSRFFLLLLALLAVVACPGGDNSQVSETVPGEPVLAVCPKVFLPAAPASSRASEPTAQLPTPNVKLSSCTQNNGNITIGPGACGPNVFVDQTQTIPGTITIASGGELVFTDDEPRTLTTAAIIVDGVLSAGTPECALEKQITIKFMGERTCDAPGNCTTDDDTTFSKGILVRKGGTLWLFGAKGVPTQKSGVSWTYLSLPAGPVTYADTDKDGKPTKVSSPVQSADVNTKLHLADNVKTGTVPWQVDDWIAVATTSFSPFETEFVQIEDISQDGHTITLKQEQKLQFYHFGGPAPSGSGTTNPDCKDSKNKLLPAFFCDGADKNWGVDERAEVGLISRNIKLTSDAPASGKDRHWGGELKFLPGFKEVSIQGVEIEKFGKDQLGSYPIHLHADPTTPNNVKDQTLVNANSIHHSYNKCITVHSTQNLTIQNNVCARVVGHIFYQEWGNEEGVSYVNNLGLGAMSNSFDIHASLTQTRQTLIDDFWWAGDNLAKSPNFNYDGFNIPNTDAQTNPTHGTCWTVKPDGGLVGGGDPPCTQEKGQPLYIEPASGFWIINPGTRLSGNSIGGCQGVGRGYWYVPPNDGSETALKFKLVGEFKNNRVHSCYSGVYDEPEYSVKSEQLFPRKAGTQFTSNPRLPSPPVIATLDGITATRNRFRGVWLRPLWFVIKNARLATNRENVTLVSSGGLEGNHPGVWALLTDSVVVGLSENNVDRFGPCPNNSFVVGGAGIGCIDRTPVTGSPPFTSGDEIGEGYPPPKWNFFGYMIYDGPVRIFNNRFVNFNLKPRLTQTDQTFLDDNSAKLIPAGGIYEGDAVLGWFQGNQSAYPTATAGKGFSFTNVDLRHQIYTDKVNISSFGDGDQNTAVIDLDGTLTGFKVVDSKGNEVVDSKGNEAAFPISLNNLLFNASSNSVDECLSQGAANAELEGRPTSLISPGSMATLEFGALFPPPLPESLECDVTGGGKAKCTKQAVTFTKDIKDFTNFPQQQMTLTSRDGRGIWEPKVTSGYGYTVGADFCKDKAECSFNFKDGQAGIPAVVSVGLTDAVKPNISTTDPFFVRIGICYTDTNKLHPPAATTFTIKRGYKSYGGSLVEPSDQGLRKFWNQLIGRFPANENAETCDSLDFLQPGNRNPAKGCPAHGVTPQDGTCPPGSKDSTNPPGDCIYPNLDPLVPLKSAGSVGELMNGNLPILDKYYYDADVGMLFFNVVQDTANPVGPSPLGSCTGDKTTDNPFCPDFQHDESYYACPPQGCIHYVVQLNTTTDYPYTNPGPSTCVPYPKYEQKSPPANEFRLAYRDTTFGTIVNRSTPHSLYLFVVL